MRTALMRPLDGGFYVVRTLYGFKQAVSHFDSQALRNQIFGTPHAHQLPALVALRSIYCPDGRCLVQAKTIPMTGQAAADFVALVDSIGAKRRKYNMYPLGNHLYIVNNLRGFKRALAMYDYTITLAQATGIPATFPALVSFGYVWGGAVHANCILLDDVADCFLSAGAG